jgi:adenine-specific DNA-methyltransferase
MAKRNYDGWTKEDFIREIEKLRKRKKYGVVWDEEKTKEKFEREAEGNLPVVKEVKSKEIKTDKNKPINILIEGDNYHSLSVLNYTHKGAIDVIYIDPPYNTGNKEFIYNDKIIDLEDSYRHSKWLSFMAKRLLLAKNLLKTKGFIFISIDDNEVAQLKLLCNEIFLEKNFVAQFIWNKKNVVQNDARFVSTNHEYVLCYGKNIDGLNFNLLPRTNELNQRYQNPDNDSRGPWTSVALQAKSGTEANVYEITFPNGARWKPVPGTYPRLKKESLLKAYHEGRLWFGKSGKNVPRLKKYLSEVKQGYVSNSILLPSYVGSTQIAKEILKRIIGKNIFETPKPPALIKRFILLAESNKNVTILDFFAGSGTVGQTVLELNKEDGGNRKFILCTNNENNICTEVCYPRIDKIINGHVTPNKEKIKGLGGNLKYFKTAFVEGEPTDENKKMLVDQSTEMLCLKEDCFEETKSNHYFKIFKNSFGKYLGIIYDDDGIEPFKKEAKKLNKKINVYVFSLDESAREEEFEDIEKLVELRPIPAVILNVYKRIFK